MPGEQPYLPRPGISEQSIVEEMMRNRDSEHWKPCNDFVKHQVYIRAKNSSWSSQEEIIQESMYRVARHLSDFRFEWLLKPGHIRSLDTVLLIRIKG